MKIQVEFTIDDETGIRMLSAWAVVDGVRQALGVANLSPTGVMLRIVDRSEKAWSLYLAPVLDARNPPPEMTANPIFAEVEIRQDGSVLFKSDYDAT